MSVVATAVFYGALSALALPLGALIGVLWRPPDRLLAVLLAFGGGALLAALTLDLVAPGIDRGHFSDLAIGCVLGGLLFKALDRAVSRKGGYLRKPSTALTHWRRSARTRLAGLLQDLHRVKHIGDLDDSMREQLLAMMSVVDAPRGTWIYRTGEQARTLYIVEKGAVDLVDPATGEAVATLGPHDVFGRMSFVTGLPRATEAHTRAGARLLRIPREGLLQLVREEPKWRSVMLGMVDASEVETYLVQRHGMSLQDASEWRTEAAAALRADGFYDPPSPDAVPDVTDLVDLLAAERRSEFAALVPRSSLRALAQRMTHREVSDGVVLHHAGERADRLQLVRRGVVHLIDPQPLDSTPRVVRAGETFGALPFLTGATHGTTAVAHGEVALSAVDRDDFTDVLDEDDGLRHAVGQFLRRQRVGDFVAEREHVPARTAHAWIERSVRSIEGVHVMPSTEGLSHVRAAGGGAAMAIFLGILLDGIPESFVIGANVLNSGGITLSLLAGLFLANFPEALSSAAGMRDQAMSRTRILTMWIIVMVITGAGAGVGAVVLQEAPGTVFALIEGLAAGAMLTMIAETMLPEAYHKGGGVVGLSTLGGFLAAILANHVR